MSRPVQVHRVDYRTCDGERSDLPVRTDRHRYGSVEVRCPRKLAGPRVRVGAIEAITWVDEEVDEEHTDAGRRVGIAGIWPTF